MCWQCKEYSNVNNNLCTCYYTSSSLFDSIFVFAVKLWALFFCRRIKWFEIVCDLFSLRLQVAMKTWRLYKLLFSAQLTLHFYLLSLQIQMCTAAKKSFTKRTEMFHFDLQHKNVINNYSFLHSSFVFVIWMPCIEMRIEE